MATVRRTVAIDTDQVATVQGTVAIDTAQMVTVHVAIAIVTAPIATVQGYGRHLNHSNVASQHEFVYKNPYHGLNVHKVNDH